MAMKLDTRDRRCAQEGLVDDAVVAAQPRAHGAAAQIGTP
jgi:hypothetical protein